jgi:hypothetical protein
LSSRKVVLGDLWNNAGKSQYLDRLKHEGLAIDIAPTGRSVQTESNGSVGVQVTPFVRKGRVPKDKHLISNADQNPFVQYPNLDRAEKIWRELQFELEFDRHDNAIAVAPADLRKRPERLKASFEKVFRDFKVKQSS